MSNLDNCLNCRGHLPKKLQGLTSQFKDVIWAAFGEDANCYFISYVNKADKTLISKCHDQYWIGSEFTTMLTP